MGLAGFGPFVLHFFLNFEENFDALFVHFLCTSYALFMYFLCTFYALLKSA